MLKSGRTTRNRGKTYKSVNNRSYGIQVSYLTELPRRGLRTARAGKFIPYNQKLGIHHRQRPKDGHYNQLYD
jgi:hypothetical protein